MIDIMRSFEFDAGHRILGHESKCANLHGHRYKAEIVFYANELDSLGRVIDFGVVKGVVGSWIDLYWDHAMILHSDDPLVQAVKILFEQSPPKDNEANVDIREEIWGPKPPYLLHMNPTAENLAKHLFGIATELLKNHNVSVRVVKLWETPNCYALYMPDPKSIEEFKAAADKAINDMTAKMLPMLEDYLCKKNTTKD